jgi:OHCU decarboxylase
LSRESTAEQRAAGLDPDALSGEEIARFQAANHAYRQKFGFPFVICARENRKETILSGLDSRLGNDRQTEMATALAEIGKIAWHRLRDLVQDDAFRRERA